MGTRNIEFFCTIQEYTDLIYEIVEEFHLHILLTISLSKRKKNGNYYIKYDQLINPKKPTFYEKIKAKNNFVVKIFLSCNSIAENQLNPQSTPLGKWQWLMGFPPELKKDGLYSGDLGTRSDWYISEDDYGDNREIFDLFSKIKRKILKRIKKPMWIVFSPTDYRLIRDVGYTEGAEEFVKNGGILKSLSSPCMHTLQEPSPPPNNS